MPRIGLEKVRTSSESVQRKRLYGSRLRSRPCAKPKSEKRLYGSKLKSRPCAKPKSERRLYGSRLRSRPCAKPKHERISNALRQSWRSHLGSEGGFTERRWPSPCSRR